MAIGLDLNWLFSEVLSVGETVTICPLNPPLVGDLTEAVSAS